MNRPFLILLGAAATVWASLIGMVVVPNWQIRGLVPITVVGEVGPDTQYPLALDPWKEAPGRQVYKAQGCIYCHSQQVRPASMSADIERGWGERRSVPLDYLYQNPPLLGTMRTGPDLANIGARQPSEQWHHLHLYDARIVTSGSIMPPFRYLYTLHKSEPGAGSYKLPDKALGQDTWIVPTEEAINLVAYLKSLHQDRPLEEVQ